MFVDKAKLYIRAGKGGNAVVAIERTVVQGLGVGDLCTIEQIVPLPILHIADGSSGIFRARRIVGDGGGAEVVAEAADVQP